MNEHASAPSRWGIGASEACQALGHRLHCDRPAVAFLSVIEAASLPVRDEFRRRAREDGLRAAFAWRDLVQIEAHQVKE